MPLDRARKTVYLSSQQSPLYGPQVSYAAPITEPVTGASPFYKYQIDAIWASLERRLPTLNGYSGNLPKGWLPLWENVIRTPDDRKRIEAFLRRWPAEHKIHFDERCWVAAVPRDTPGGGNLVSGPKP